MDMGFETTKKLSSFLTGIDYDLLPGEVVIRTKRSLLDWIGSAYSGIGSPTDEAVRSLIKEWGGKGVATLINAKQSAPVLEAAQYNSMISAVMEVDDVHRDCSLHPGIGVIPAAIAVAEYTGASGKDLIAAIVAGYDLSVRVARASGPTHYNYWHSTGTCNSFGAAAAAGKLLHLDEEKLTMALGLAGTQGAGLWESLNAKATMAKHLHSGKACSNGIFSAFLARNGFKGSSTILEGERGFLAAFSKATSEDIRNLTIGLAEPFLIMRNFFKRHACCRGCFEGIEGIDRILTSRGLRPEDIEEIRVTMKPMRTWLVGIENPVDIYEAKFSLPFCMALKVIKQGAGLYEFNEKNLHDPGIREFMKKIKMRIDPEIVARARIQVVCKNRTVFVEEPVCQSLSLEEVEKKFIDHMSPILKEQEIERILSMTNGLETIGHISEMTRMLKKITIRRKLK